MTTANERAALTTIDKKAALTFFFLRFRDLMADFALSPLREQMDAKGARESYRQVIKSLEITLCNLRAAALTELGAEAVREMERQST